MKTVQKHYKKELEHQKTLDKNHRFTSGLTPRIPSTELIKG